MDRKNSVLAVIFVAFLLLLPTLSVATTNIHYGQGQGLQPMPEKEIRTNSENEIRDNLHCMKSVWDNDTQTWVDQITITPDQRIRFNITVLYIGNSSLFEISIVDILPKQLEYAGNATIPETAMSGRKIYWNLTTTLLPNESLSIEFDAFVNTTSAAISIMITNTATVSAVECGIGEVQCEDTAYIIIEPALQICEKQVWDTETEEWVEETDANIEDTIRFRIIISYHGDYTLYNICVKDTLPDGLTYANNAVPEEPVIAGNNLYWNLTEVLQDGENLTIEFDSIVVTNGLKTNFVTVTANECSGDIHYCSDSARVSVDDVPKICEKQVWDTDSGQWVKETTAFVGDTIRFRITITYYGNYTLYTIHVKDTLPDGLTYANNAVPEEPVIAGNNLYWNLTETLHDGESFTIEFDAQVTADGLQTNFVSVTANECSGETWNCCDTASVLVEESCKICEKQVWDTETEEWVEETDANIGDIIRFRITITYYGNYTLYNIHVKDTLPDGLTYANNAVPEEPVIAGNNLYWNLTDRLSNGEQTIIEFDAEVTADGVLVNFISITANECCGAIRYCTDTAVVTAEVANNLISDAGGPYQGYAGLPIQFTGTVTGGTPPYTYRWYFDDGQLSNNRNPSHIYTTPGSYLVSFMVTDYLGLISMDTANVTVKEDITPPTLEIKKPVNQALYIQNEYISWFFTTVIIGSIEVEVSAFDTETSIKQVQFYIDNELQNTQTTEPFRWIWSDGSIGKHTLLVVAEDGAGNNQFKMISAWKLF